VSLQQIVPWLLALQAATIVGMVLTAGADLTVATGLLAAAFVGGALAGVVRANVPYWRTPRTAAEPDRHPLVAARRNTRLAALTYAWAGLAMQALYTTPLTGLRWHHGWQYALIFALLAFAAFAYARALAPEGQAAAPTPLARLAAPLAIVQGIIAAGGLTYLAGSGKLLLHRADWAANIIFVSAALAIMVLSAVSLRTHVTLMRRME
jgi:hypothetical protein